MSHDIYKKLDVPADRVLTACPVCGSEAELWQYSETEESPTTKAVCCTRSESLVPGTEDGLMGGCPLYMPPNHHYHATIREAIDYWDRYSKSLRAIRASNERL